MSKGTCGKCGKDLVDTCPECGMPVETYSRVTGYLTPLSRWNFGKVQEFKDRTEFTHWGQDHEWYHKYKENLTNGQDKDTR